MTRPPTRPGPALVLGCSGGLGAAVVRELLERGTTVVGLVRTTPSTDSVFVRERLFERVRVVRGDVRDAGRLATLLAVHGVESVFQCAAVPGSAAATHALTRRVLAAVAVGKSSAAVVVPLPLVGGGPRFSTRPAGGLRVAFARLPAGAEGSAAALLVDAADAVAACDPVPALGLWPAAARVAPPRAA